MDGDKFALKILCYLLLHSNPLTYFIWWTVFEPIQRSQNCLGDHIKKACRYPNSLRIFVLYVSGYDDSNNVFSVSYSSITCQFLLTNEKNEKIFKSTRIFIFDTWPCILTYKELIIIIRVSIFIRHCMSTDLAACILNISWILWGFSLHTTQKIFLLKL